MSDVLDDAIDAAVDVYLADLAADYGRGGASRYLRHLADENVRRDVLTDFSERAEEEGFV